MLDPTVSSEDSVTEALQLDRPRVLKMLDLCHGFANISLFTSLRLAAAASSFPSRSAIDACGLPLQ